MTPDTSTPRCDAHNSTTKNGPSRVISSSLVVNSPNPTMPSGNVDFVLARRLDELGLFQLGEV